MHNPKKILFGVLNWGLGHATRSIPIIQNFLDEGHEVLIASDGDSLSLLKQTFPYLITEKLPSYQIKYSKNPKFLKMTLLAQLPHILKTKKQEEKITRSLVEEYEIDTIVSDNRFGLWHPDVKSIYITHQLRVLSGWTTFITTFLHRLIYQKYDEIWVPDRQFQPNFSGKLGHLKNPSEKIKYIGPKTRFEIKEMRKKYDILVILSGPEPQRTILENILLNQLATLPFKTALIQGKVAAEKEISTRKNVTIYNYLTGYDLENLINASGLIISRSGYTSIMDLLSLHKKVLWIPTPGQYEQEYLAKYLQKNGNGISISQKNIQLDKTLLKKLLQAKP